MGIDVLPGQGQRMGKSYLRKYGSSRLSSVRTWAGVLPRIFVLALLAAPAWAQQGSHFQGSVRVKEDYRRDIGNGLVFVLKWVGLGWDIRIETKDSPDDLIRCVTGPAYGPQSTDLYAWHFVDRDTNERLPAGKEYLSAIRHFDFVLNQKDRAKACDELQVLLYKPPKEDPKTGGLVLGTPGYQPPPVGTGRVTIKSFELTNLGKGKEASPVSITFEADLDPRPQRNPIWP